MIGGLIGIVALILGGIGLNRSKKLRSGRGLAIAGIILGIMDFNAGVLFPLFAAQRMAAKLAHMQSIANEKVGKPAPTFELQRWGGPPVTNASLNGNLYILDFWVGADDLPKLDALAKKYKSNGLKVFGVVDAREPSTAVWKKDDGGNKVLVSRETLLDFERKNDLNVPLLMDTDNFDVGRTFGTPEFPHMAVLVGRTGNVIAASVAPNYDELDAVVQRSLDVSQ